ncbi:oxygen-insensitive NADPH nitroreductase [Paenibacillus sp. N1-5-1-14]|uniref:oxygen-insensitive NADPH nitroreductase n=1 Tax=Paenibacillus radicibacter TaxID=2972488 RepID=UPI002158F2F6|nr:oxygen-insensitive NADPH nitroreductase [Paenibacillus radicibacter]MCR8642719.1 oxygen-insensitive NADPH nitroreductase [Paenibacillus radicibacter]
MNPVIETIMNHRSIRQFEDRLLTDEQIHTIVQAAQAASTSSFIQAYSIIGIKDKEKKKRLAELCGDQSYVARNGHLFVFCADLHRHELIGQMEEVDVLPSLESTEKFMVALIDATLAAQNAVIAAESMGLGICYIGGLRNKLDEVSQVLKTPARVIPLFAITMGYPLQESSQKPRLPLAHVYHEEEYEQDEWRTKEQLAEYNKTIQDYYTERAGGKRSDTWTSQMANMLSKQSRMYMKSHLEEQGWNKR